MAHEVKLEVYSFGLRKFGKSKDYLPLNSVFGDQSFVDIFQDYLNHISDFELNEKQKKVLRCNHDIKFNSKARTIRGCFESGDYGIESEIVNLKSKRKTKKGADDSEILLFYFLLYIPEDKDHGLIMLQRLGHYGIHTPFTASLKNFIKIKERDVNIDFKPFISKRMVGDFLEKGFVKEVVLTKYSLPSDPSDKLTLRNYFEDELVLEYRIKSKKGKWFNKRDIKSFIKDPNARFYEIEELKNTGFDHPDKISIVSSLDGNTRTIDLDENLKIRPYYDIDKQVTKEKGSPVFSSIDLEALKLLEEFKLEDV